EFVPAHPRSEAASAVRRTSEQLGNGLQQFIAHRMAERIVDPLELVQIDEHDRYGSAGLLRQRSIQLLAELQQVAQSRQLVMIRQIGEPVCGSLLVRHVTDDDERLELAVHLEAL